MAEVISLMHYSHNNFKMSEIPSNTCIGAPSVYFKMATVTRTVKGMTQVNSNFAVTGMKIEKSTAVFS